MSPIAISLLDVDEIVLERMVVAATSDALADEVTAPVTPGNVWTAERIEWLRALHRDRRDGIEGELREATWAIALNDDIVGQIRLKELDDSGAFETGMWLTRSARGRGIGQHAITVVAALARDRGGRILRADTMNWNRAAQGALVHLGFVLDAPDADGGIRATLTL